MRISDWSSDVCSSDLRAVDHLAADADLEPTEQRGIDREIDGDVAAQPLTQRRLERVDLRARKRVRRGDFGGGFAAMLRGERPEQLGRASCQGRVWQYV